MVFVAAADLWVKTSLFVGTGVPCVHSAVVSLLKGSNGCQVVTLIESSDGGSLHQDVLASCPSGSVGYA
jgi:hypothetical protein